MRILYICQSDFTGPGEKLLFYMANELARGGHAAMMLVNGEPGTVATMSQEPAFELHRLVFKGTRLAPDLFENIARFKPEVAHAQYIRNEPLQAGLEVKRRLNIPLVVHHDDAEEAIFQMRFKRWWEKPISWARLAAGTWVNPKWWHWYNPRLKKHEAQIDAHDCLTQALKDDLKRRCGLEASHIFQGLDLDFYELPPKLDKSHAPAGVGKDDFVVMYNGALHRATLADFEMLLDTVVLLRREIPNLRLVFSGSNYKPVEVTRCVHKRGLEPHVTALGLVPTLRELRDHFSYANVFVQPGRKTHFNELRLPSKLMFYLAAGRPIVTFDFGFGRLLEHLKDAVLYPEYTPEAMARAVRLVHDDPRLAESLGRHAQLTARRLFDVRKTTRDFLDLYGASMRATRTA